jgi:16S rRNA (guanine1207-N2)-methyltransferase
VFSKRTLDTGTAILIDVLLDENISGKVLDLGCGYGPVGLTLARFHPQLELTLADINEQAVRDAQHNATSLGYSTLRIVVSNGFEELAQKFDVIAFNPPIRAGKKAIYDLYQQTKQHLHSTGRLYIVIRKDKGALTHRAYLETLFSEVQLLRRDQGYHVLVAKH